MQKLIQFFEEEKLGLLLLFIVPLIIYFAWGSTYLIMWYVAFFAGIAYAPYHV